jgi:hypothetical protein
MVLSACLKVVTLAATVSQSACVTSIAVITAQEQHAQAHIQYTERLEHMPTDIQ